jgi:hypothetical protein
MKRQDDFHADGLNSVDCGVNIIDFKPKQQPISGRSVRRISNRAMMMIGVPSVKLKHKLALGL